jgi:ATP-dependent Clp protease adaptor protein ClpS
VVGCCRTESSKKKPPIYKVMLHNDNYNRREYVVKILLKTVEGLTVDDAVNVMQVGGRSQQAGMWKLF